jgi:hypothetical protein
MKLILRTILLATLAFNLVGCASPYLKNRARDAADIFTFTTGAGAGGKARIGPVSAGLVYQKDALGLRNGVGFATRPTWKFEDGPGGKEFCYGFLGAETSNQGERVTQRGKEFSTVYFLVPIDADRVTPPHYYSQIEVTAGAGLGFRVGFNPGELVDFILGWAALDLFKDDVGLSLNASVGSVGPK